MDLGSIQRELFSIFDLFSVVLCFLNLYEEKVGSYHQIAFKKKLEHDRQNVNINNAPSNHRYNLSTRCLLHTTTNYSTII